MIEKIKKLKEFAQEQKQKSLDFYKHTHHVSFTGEVVAFDLMIEEIDKILLSDSENEHDKKRS